MPPVFGFGEALTWLRAGCRLTQTSAWLTRSYQKSRTAIPTDRPIPNSPSPSSRAKVATTARAGNENARRAPPVYCHPFSVFYRLAADSSHSHAMHACRPTNSRTLGAPAVRKATIRARPAARLLGGEPFARPAARLLVGEPFATMRRPPGLPPRPLWQGTLRLPRRFFFSPPHPGLRSQRPTGTPIPTPSLLGPPVPPVRRRAP